MPIPLSYRIIFLSVLLNPTSDIFCGICSLSSVICPQGDIRRANERISIMKDAKSYKMQKLKAWLLVQSFSVAALLTFGAR